MANFFPFQHKQTILILARIFTVSSHTLSHRVLSLAPKLEGKPNHKTEFCIKKVRAGLIAWHLSRPEQEGQGTLVIFFICSLGGLLPAEHHILN